MKYMPCIGASVCFLWMFWFCGPYSVVNAVPAAPNAATLEGIVKEYCTSSSDLWDIRPVQVIYRLTIFVEDTGGRGDSPNFLRGKEKQMLLFFTKEEISSELLNKRIKAEVEYRGDEKGGRFWIRNIQIIRAGD